MNIKDIIIIGAGPAGVSAGIYALRAGANALIFDNGKSTLREAKNIQNYYGIPSISGEELYQNGIYQIEKLGGEIIKDEIVGIKQEFEANTFIVKTKNAEYVTKSIILCTGNKKKKTFPEIDKYAGQNVSYCAICDGFFYKNRTIAVIGSGEFAISECKELSKIVEKIYLITNGDLITCNLNNVEVISEKIDRVLGLDKLNGFVFEGGRQINVDGCFMAVGTLSSLEIAKQLGVITKNNFIMVDKNCMTNIPGVFAGGDVIGGLLQVSKAVSDGAIAGIEAVRYIKILEIK